jgi:hypothetical protein
MGLTQQSARKHWKDGDKAAKNPLPTKSASTSQKETKSSHSHINLHPTYKDGHSGQSSRKITLTIYFG